MDVFEPIAIVGQAVLLPGAHDPDQLWEAVAEGRSLIQPVPEDRWGVSTDHILGPAHPDHARTHLGGYVGGFHSGFLERLHDDPFGVPSEVIAPLDPLFHWVLHTSRTALRQAGGGDGARVGAILGNLSFPSAGMSRFAESVWIRNHGDALLAGRAEAMLNREPAQARDLQMSGGPIRLLRSALGLSGPTFALDAACASSLYAIKLAIDRLHDRSADLMLAGAVNRADDLFIHVGFSALQALSPTGQTRPFHREADGLLPAEGAAVFALKRLADAHMAGDTIHGVIMGVGLANDGRARNLLAPASEGQVQALRTAYQTSQVSPEQVGLIEAHATGTPVGDRTEVQTLSEVFPDAESLPLGSLKSNLGHLITAAGGAGLVKVLAAMKHQQLPPTLHVDTPIPELDGSPLRLIRDLEPWKSDRPRVAGINAFGFGGNNAHLIVQEDPGPTSSPRSPAPKAPPERLAVVGMGGLIGPLSDLDAFADAWLGGGSILRNGQGRMDTVTLPLRSLRSPPKDLEEALAQQTALLRATLDAIHDAPEFEPATTQVLVAAQADPEVARYGLRWRLAQWLESWTDAPAEDWLEEAKQATASPLTAAGVVGRMPNIPANRINAHLNAKGASFTVASEERSSQYALQVACRALLHGEADTVVLGASDLRCEPVSLASNPDRTAPPGDAAVALILMRGSEAIERDLPVYAFLEPTEPTSDPGPSLDPDAQDFLARFGDAHAASGLVSLVAAILSVQRGVSPMSLDDDAGPCTSLHWGPSDDDEPGLCWRVLAPMGGTARRNPPKPTPSHPGDLTLPAHPSPVVLPALPGDPERLAPAPLLALEAAGPDTSPTGFEEEPPLGRVPAPPREDAPPVVPLAPPPVRPVVPARPPSSPAAAAALTIAGAVQRLRSSHQAWVSEQHALHHQFLGLRNLALRQLQQRTTPGPNRPPPGPTRVSPPKRHPTATPSAPAEATAAEPELPGPRYSRAQLEHLSRGRLADVLGEAFASLDGYERVVRMPEPPLLLADRVVGIDAEPNSMGRGTIWTETDVVPDAWYMHDDRMPAGIMIESGQADLLLISYLGIDRYNQGERVYRLLGCTLTYHGGLPRPGETLRYDIHVDAHAQQGPIRLFFFHYDCHSAVGRRLSVREGQAGFFTDQELEDSGGILWVPTDHTPDPNTRVDPPPVACAKTSFGPHEVLAYAEGRGAHVFGEGFERLASHVHSPRISAPPMLFWDHVTHCEVRGGPWRRGYLRATQAIAPDDWFFEGHFNADPCMPGTLMFEGCLQALAFYMTAYGLTLDHDGSAFEPVPEVPYDLRCRGQVTPESRELVYEIFIEEVHDGPTPTVFADFLCTVDGLKAFHARRVGVQLTPDTPLSRRLLPPRTVRGPAASPEGLALDERSLLSCAWGKPSEAFGPRFTRYDQGLHVARLPGPPYHFMSRVESVEGFQGRVEPGTSIELAYDIPSDAWYFDTQGQRKMPFCVLLEAALQPCGWIAVYIGSTLDRDDPLFFRNLDGTGTVLAEVPEDATTLQTKTTLTKVAHAGGMILESFEVECSIAGTPVYTLETTFGFFPAEALAQQVGIPPTEAEEAALAVQDAHPVDLTQSPGPYFSGPLRMPDPMLRMIDRVTHVSLDGGANGLGRVIATKQVDPNEWFFKAHFYSDPVQPGSLGIEAMIQTLQFFAIHADLAKDMATPRFEAIAVNQPMTWRYRGQVIPTNREVTVELDVTEVRRDGTQVTLIGDAWLWVDGRRIYGAEGLGVRVIDDHDGVPLTTPVPALTEAREPWVQDHVPTFVQPVAPASWMLNELTGAAADRVPSRQIGGLRSVTLHRWLTLSSAASLQTRTSWIDGDTLQVQLEGREGQGDWQTIAEGQVELTDDLPLAPWGPPVAADASTIRAPYADGHLPHGPRLQLLTHLAHGPRGSTARVDASKDPTPDAWISPGLLDAMAQAIPHTTLHLWFPHIGEAFVGYPGHIKHLRRFGPLPRTGEHRIEVRPERRNAELTTPSVRVSLMVEGRLRLDMVVDLVLVPAGPLGVAPPALRARFLRDRTYAEGLGLSTTDADGVTTLTRTTLDEQNWLPGTVESVYGLDPQDPSLSDIAQRDHVSRILQVHPSQLEHQDGDWTCPAQPYARVQVKVQDGTEDVRVSTESQTLIHTASLAAWWRERISSPHDALVDIHLALVRKFVARASVESPEALASVRGRPTLWIANHQTAIESILFGMLAGPLFGGFPLALAKKEHAQSWLGRWLEHGWGAGREEGQRVLAYLDREDPTALPSTLEALLSAGDTRLLIHVEGTRATACRQPVTGLSSAILEAAIRHDAVLIPVRFSGGLPVDPVDTKLDFPLEMGRQVISIGTPILPQAFAEQGLAEAKRTLCEAVMAVGDPYGLEQPLAGDPVFGTRVKAWQESTGASHAHAVMLECLRDMPEVCASSARLLDALSDGVLSLRDTNADRYLEGLARPLFGPHGPKISIG